MTASSYIPGAEMHLLDDAAMAGDGGARVIWHITWDKNASKDAPADLVPFDNLASYFSSGGKGMAPTLLWDPFTGRIAQFFSGFSRAKAVVNAPGGVETNRKGNVCIQIEILFFPYCRVNGRVYATVADTPCQGLDKIMAWLRAWGVPDTWPMGEPDWSSHRDSSIWNSHSGHYGHSQVPENDHTDPGPMPRLFDASAPPSGSQPPSSSGGSDAPYYPAYDGHLIVNYTESERVRIWQAYMKWRGWTITVDGEYGDQSERVCRAYQAQCNAQGYNVGDVDGKLGKNTWYMTQHKPVTRP